MCLKTKAKAQAGRCRSPSRHPNGLGVRRRDADQVDLRKFFTDLIKDRDGELHGPMHAALALDLEDDRAVVDNIEFELVDVNGNDIHVSYIVPMSAYHGCSDANYADDDHRMINGTAGARSGSSIRMSALSSSRPTKSCDVEGRLRAPWTVAGRIVIANDFTRLAAWGQAAPHAHLARKGVPD